MSSWEIPCCFCGGPISSADLGDESIAVVLAEGPDGITMAAHREPCYRDEQRMMEAEYRRDAMMENFPDWDSR